jgi:hypothetical protein
VVAVIRIHVALEQSSRDRQCLPANRLFQRIEVQSIRRVLAYERCDLFGDFLIERFLEPPFSAASAALTLLVS